jgi:hypothetical protein
MRDSVKHVTRSHPELAEGGATTPFMLRHPQQERLYVFPSTLILHKFPLSGREQAIQKGFQANLQAARHYPFIPELEFIEGGIFPFRQIFRPTALGSLEEGLARARLCN